MTSPDKKRLIREEKRKLKKQGNRKKRNFFKSQLKNDPEEVSIKDDFEFKYNSSTVFNGMDDDKTREKPADIEKPLDL